MKRTGKWRSILLHNSSILRDVVESLENSGKGIVIILSSEEVLQGVVTDGDLRRAFVNGHDLNTPAVSIMNANPLTKTGPIDINSANQFMMSEKLRHLPIVDAKNRLIDLIFQGADLNSEIFDNIVFIMAGGFGSRLGKLTEQCPKPMLEVHGKPILEHIILKAKAKGFSNFIVSTHHLGDVIEGYFGDGSRFGVAVSYLKEETPLGTAGCLTILKKVPKLPMIVVNGDVLTDVNYADMLHHHEKYEANVTMGVRQHQIQNPFGVVVLENLDIVGFKEKPVYDSVVNAGIYVLDPKVIELLDKKSRYDMPEVFERVIEKGLTATAFFIGGAWLDIGRPDDLRLARMQTR
jgi:dTDP-glucose pyrophosphorylase